MGNKQSRILIALFLLLMAGGVKAQTVADSIVVKVQDMADSIVVNVHRVADSLVVKVRNVADTTALNMYSTTNAEALAAHPVIPKAAPTTAFAAPAVADTAATMPPASSIVAKNRFGRKSARRARLNAYSKGRGMINREATKNVFIPKGQWMLGGQVGWNQWNNENLNYLVLKDINFEGYSFSAGPYFGYFVSNNLAVGGRFAYQRYYLNLGELDLNLGDDLNISLKDLYYLQHNYESNVFLRSYLPIGNSKIFGFLGEFQLNYTFSEGRNNTGADDTFTAVYEKCHSLELGLAGGMAVFLTNFVAAEVMVNVGGYRFKWGEQNTNNIETGKLNNSGANFRLNLFSIKFGVTYYL